MKKLFVFLPATLQGNALHARLLEATDLEINYTDIESEAKQFFAHHSYPAAACQM